LELLEPLLVEEIPLDHLVVPTQQEDDNQNPIQYLNFQPQDKLMEDQQLDVNLNIGLALLKEQPSDLGDENFMKAKTTEATRL
jgi:hypothetical protein